MRWVGQLFASIPSLRVIGTKVYQCCEMPSSSISGLVQDRTRDPSQISRRVADNERVSARHCNEHPAQATGRTCPNGESTLQRTADILKRLGKAKHDRASNTQKGQWPRRARRERTTVQRTPCTGNGPDMPQRQIGSEDGGTTNSPNDCTSNMPTSLRQRDDIPRMTRVRSSLTTAKSL